MVAELGLEDGAAVGVGKPKPAARVRRTTPTTAQIVKQVRTLIGQRLQQMKETPMADSMEEQKLLETMVRTTAKLEELDRARKLAGTSPRRSTKAVLDLRQRIADRIEQLNQG
jgi:hypothetical protein